MNIYKTSILAAALGATAMGMQSYAGTRADESLLFGYCEGYSTSAGAREGGTPQLAAIEIPQERAKLWEGNQVSGVNIGYGVCSQNEVTVFLSYDLEGEPFYTQKAVMTVNQGWNSVALDTPYTITGETFYVGYQVDGASAENNKPIGFDGVPTSDKYGDFLNLYGYWEHPGMFYGNVCIRINLTGDNLPQNEVAIYDISMPPVVKVDEPFEASLQVTNKGVKSIGELSVSCEIEGQEPLSLVAFVKDGEIPSGETGEVILSGLVSTAYGVDLTATVTVTAVNGESDDPADNSVTATLSCAEEIFKKNVVVEEFTGTWCGNCPAGIVGMAYMNENYGEDGFIGIAVHYNDPMQVASYLSYVQTASDDKYPSSMVDRIFWTLPYAENLEYYYNILAQYPAAAKVSVEAVYDEDTKEILVSSETLFSFTQDNSDCALAFVITENGMGPYDQTNSFSGGGQGPMDGWENKGQKVETIFNEVARDIKSAYGIQGSVPASVVALQPYSYQTTLPVTNVVNLQQCEVVALLLDTQSGQIINACKTEIANSEAGVEGIEAEAAEARNSGVFNLQGLKISNSADPEVINSLPAGVYIIDGKKIKL